MVQSKNIIQQLTIKKHGKKKKYILDITYEFTSSYCTNTQVAICTGPLCSLSLHKYKENQAEKRTCAHTHRVGEWGGGGGNKPRSSQTLRRQLTNSFVSEKTQNIF